MKLHHCCSRWRFVLVTVVVLIACREASAFRPGYRGGGGRRGPGSSSSGGSRGKPSGTSGSSAGSSNAGAGSAPVGKGGAKGIGGSNSGPGGGYTAPSPSLFSRIFGGASSKGVPYISYRRNSKVTSNAKVKENLPLYRPKDPPPYATYAQQSYAQRPYPPPYDPSLSVNNFQGGAGKQTFYGSPPRNQQPVFSQFSQVQQTVPRRSNALLQNAIYFGLGRYFGLTGLPNYALYGPRTRLNNSPRATNSSLTEAPSSVNPPQTVAPPTVNLDQEKLFEPQQLTQQEVDALIRTPINTRPLWLNESLLNLPFYGWNYPDWSGSRYVLLKPPNPPTGFASTLANVLLGFGNFYYRKEPLELEEVVDYSLSNATNEPAALTITS